MKSRTPEELAEIATHLQRDHVLLKKDEYGYRFQHRTKPFVIHLTAATTTLESTVDPSYAFSFGTSKVVIEDYLRRIKWPTTMKEESNMQKSKTTKAAGSSKSKEKEHKPSARAIMLPLIAKEVEMDEIVDTLKKAGFADRGDKALRAQISLNKSWLHKHPDGKKKLKELKAVS